MKIFIDTANVDEIKAANDLGVICGVTTNPSLIAKEGRIFEEVVQEITTIVDGPVSAEDIGKALRKPSFKPRRGKQSHVVKQSGDGYKGESHPFRSEIRADLIGTKLLFVSHCLLSFSRDLIK